MAPTALVTTAGAATPCSMLDCQAETLLHPPFGNQSARSVWCTAASRAGWSEMCWLPLCCQDIQDRTIDLLTTSYDGQDVVGRVMRRAPIRGMRMVKLPMCRAVVLSVTVHSTAALSPRFMHGLCFLGLLHPTHLVLRVPRTTQQRASAGQRGQRRSQLVAPLHQALICATRLLDEKHQKHDGYQVCSQGVGGCLGHCGH